MNLIVVFMLHTANVKKLNKCNEMQIRVKKQIFTKNSLNKNI